MPISFWSPYHDYNTICSSHKQIHQPLSLTTAIHRILLSGLSEYLLALFPFPHPFLSSGVPQPLPRLIPWLQSIFLSWFWFSVNHYPCHSQVILWPQNKSDYVIHCVTLFMVSPKLRDKIQTFRTACIWVLTPSKKMHLFKVTVAPRGTQSRKCTWRPSLMSQVTSCLLLSECRFCHLVSLCRPASSMSGGRRVEKVCLSPAKRPLLICPTHTDRVHKRSHLIGSANSMFGSTRVI